MKKLAVAMLLCVAVTAGAQIVNTPTPGTVVQPNVYRLGDNMGGTDNFGSGEILKNMACVMNCGFEPVLAQTIFTLTATGTGTTFTGANPYDMGNGQTGGNQDGFNLWAGATVTVSESQNSESGAGNKGFTTTIASNQGSIQATTCSFTGTGPWTITCNTDHNPIDAGFAVGQTINWEGASGTGYFNQFACCTITSLSTTSISWNQTTGAPSGTATGGYLGTNEPKVYTTTTAAPVPFNAGDTVVIKMLQSPTPTALLYASTVDLGFGDNIYAEISGGGAIFGATTGGGYTLCSTCGSQSLGTRVLSTGDQAGAGLLLDNPTLLPPGSAEGVTGVDRFTNLNGTYQWSVEAHCSGSCTTGKVSVSIGRIGQTQCTGTITPTTTPTTYTGSCTFGETAPTTSNANNTLTMNVQNVYNGAPATILIDNYGFIPTSGQDSTNTSVYTDGFVQKLRDHCATTVAGARCLIRNWTSQNEETAASWTAGYYAAPQAGLLPAHGTSSLRLFDYLNLVEMLGNADPYIELPVTMTPADAAFVLEFIVGSSSTSGGAARSTLGHSAPYAFTKVFLTPCNECWNSAATYNNLPSRGNAPNCNLSSNPGPIEYYYDLSLWLRDVAIAIRADASYNSSVVQIGFPAQPQNTALSSTGIDCSVKRSKPDYVELNNYKQLSVANAVGDANLFGADYAEPYVDAVNANSASKFNQAVTAVKSLTTCGGSGTATCYPTIYETNNSTLATCGAGSPACGGGSTPPKAITQTQEDEITAGYGSCIPEVLSFLLNCQTFGLCTENLFGAVEYSNSTANYLVAKIWGDTVDHGGAMSYFNSVKYAPRPVEICSQIMNRAIVGPMISNPLTNQPTYNWPGDPYNGYPDDSYSASGGTNAQNNVPYLYSFAFNTGNNFGLVYVNTNLTTSYTVNFGGSYAPAGTVNVAQFSTSNPDLLCESPTGATTNTTTSCSVATSTLSSPSSITIPPGVTSLTYAVSGMVAATPTFSPAAGSYSSYQTVTISSTTTGATIYYTTDGSTPTTSSAVYSGPITVGVTETVNAIAAASGYSNSAVGTAAYTITQAALPVFSAGTGTYDNVLSVTITDSTPGAKIYYTKNGTTPTTSSTLYTGPVSIPQPQSLKAIAAASGYSNSGVTTATYAFTVATPVVTPSAGTYPGPLTVTITSDTNPPMFLWYTTNGTTPTSSSTPYTAPLTISSSETLKVLAGKTGFTFAPVVTNAYVIEAYTATPSFSPAAGTYTGAQTVTISSTTTGATLYYTTDGSTPTTSSAVYSGPITVGVTETVKALAVASGHSNSAVGTAAYTIN